MGTKKFALLAAAVLLTGPLVAKAASITYDFTGTVISTSGTYNSIANGSSVTGTFTIDYGAASAYSTGSVGTSAYFDAQLAGGSSNNAPPPTNSLFASTATVDGFSYASTIGAISDLQRIINQPGEPGLLTLSEDERQAGFTSSSAFTFYTIFNGSSPLSPVLDNGLLNVPALNLLDTSSQTVRSAGTFTTSNGGVAYYIDSITPVPLPAAAWLMLSGLGGLGAMVRKRKAA